MTYFTLCHGCGKLNTDSTNILGQLLQRTKSAGSIDSVVNAVSRSPAGLQQQRRGSAGVARGVLKAVTPSLSPPPSSFGGLSPSLSAWAFFWFFRSWCPVRYGRNSKARRAIDLPDNFTLQLWASRQKAFVFSVVPSREFCNGGRSEKQAAAKSDVTGRPRLRPQPLTQFESSKRTPVQRLQ